jgi:hypothetical protein
MPNELELLQQRIDQLEVERKESAVSAGMAGHVFYNTAAEDTARREFVSRITRAEDGSLRIGGFPVATVIKNELATTMGFTLKPASAPYSGGSSSGAGGGIPTSGKVPTLDDIKAGMSQETKAAVLARMKFVNQNTDQGLPWLKIR